MDDLDRETSPHGPWIPIFIRRAHDLARVRDLGVDLLSQVTYFLYFLNMSPRVLLKNSSTSFTQSGWWVNLFMCMWACLSEWCASEIWEMNPKPTLPQSIIIILFYLQVWSAWGSSIEFLSKIFFSLNHIQVELQWIPCFTYALSLSLVIFWASCPPFWSLLM